MATLINGDGNQAVYAAQDADLLSGAITNNKTVILDVGEKFRAEVLSSSIIEVHDGVILTKEGRRIELDQNAVDLFEFPAGAQGVVSWYYIGYKLEIDEDSHQICSTFVQKMDSEGDTIPEGSFRDGDQEVYISIYHVQQDTLGVLTPTLVLTENMTMIDVLDNLIGSASDLPDPTKTVTKNIDQINSDLLEECKVHLAALTGTVDCSAPDNETIGYKTTGANAVLIQTLSGYPSGKRTINFTTRYAYVGQENHIAMLNIADGGRIFANSKTPGTVTFCIEVLYTDV
jgi:hypothetical protein